MEKKTKCALAQLAFLCSQRMDVDAKENGLSIEMQNLFVYTLKVTAAPNRFTNAVNGRDSREPGCANG